MCQDFFHKLYMHMYVRMYIGMYVCMYILLFGKFDCQNIVQCISIKQASSVIEIYFAQNPVKSTTNFI